MVLQGCVHGLYRLSQLLGPFGIFRNPETPQGFTFAFRLVHARLDALSNEISFQLGIGDGDVVHHFTHLTDPIQPSLLVTLDPPVFQLLQGLGGVQNRTKGPVHAPHYNHVNLLQSGIGQSGGSVQTGG